MGSHSVNRYTQNGKWCTLHLKQLLYVGGILGIIVRSSDQKWSDIIYFSLARDQDHHLQIDLARVKWITHGGISKIDFKESKNTIIIADHVNDYWNILGTHRDMTNCWGSAGLTASKKNQKGLSSGRCNQAIHQLTIPYTIHRVRSESDRRNTLLG